MAVKRKSKGGKSAATRKKEKSEADKVRLQRARDTKKARELQDHLETEIEVRGPNHCGGTEGEAENSETFPDSQADSTMDVDAAPPAELEIPEGVAEGGFHDSTEEIDQVDLGSKPTGTTLDVHASSTMIVDAVPPAAMETPAGVAEDGVHNSTEEINQVDSGTEPTGTTLDIHASSTMIVEAAPPAASETPAKVVEAGLHAFEEIDQVDMGPERIKTTSDVHASSSMNVEATSSAAPRTPARRVNRENTKIASPLTPSAKPSNLLQSNKSLDTVVDGRGTREEGNSALRNRRRADEDEVVSARASPRKRSSQPGADAEGGLLTIPAYTRHGLPYKDAVSDLDNREETMDEHGAIIKGGEVEELDDAKLESLRLTKQADVLKARRAYSLARVIQTHKNIPITGGVEIRMNQKFNRVTMQGPKTRWSYVECKNGDFVPGKGDDYEFAPTGQKKRVPCGCEFCSKVKMAVKWDMLGRSTKEDWDYFYEHGHRRPISYTETPKRSPKQLRLLEPNPAQGGGMGSSSKRKARGDVDETRSGAGGKKQKIAPAGIIQGLESMALGAGVEDAAMEDVGDDAIGGEGKADNG